MEKQKLSIEIQQFAPKKNMLLRGKPLFDLCAEHPYVTAAFFSVCCLFIGQKHHILKGTAQYTAGEDGAFLSLPKLCLVLAAIFLTAQLCVAVKERKKPQEDPVPSLLATAGVTVSVFALGLFGLSAVSVYTVAALIALCLWIRRAALSLAKRIISAAGVLGGGAGIRYLLTTDYTPSEKAVLISALVCAVSLVILAADEGIKTKHVIAIMFVMGFALRLGYVLNVMVPDNQHDVFPIYFNAKYPRHNTYIWHIYETGKLPTENVYDVNQLSQLYHPPLHHYTAALWMRFQNLLGIDAFAAYENIQYLTLFYSAAIMVAADKLFLHFKFSGGLRIALFALIAFHPSFYILAGSINNDVLCILLMAVAALYSVRWYENPSLYNTVALALSIGGAMLAKLSGAVVAFGTAYLMLAKLLDLRTGIVNNFKALWHRFLVFGAICFPLGLWWSVRCNLLYGMPFGYVPSMSQSPANEQYLHGFSYWERLSGKGSVTLQNLYPNIGGTDVLGGEGRFFDYGIAPYAFKSSFFGEYFHKLNVTPFQNKLAYAITFAALALVLFSLVGMAVGFYVGYRNDRSHNIRKNPFLVQGQEQGFRFVLIFHAAMVASYVLFCFKYPFTCTMDFRYIVPTLITGAVSAGVFLSGDHKWKRPLKYVYIAITAVFCLASAAFYVISYGAPA
ncbi:MAG: glycosyltransferase family 39 protein [Ruminococcaceae bacterium]|nr:glycosyltransferase family 39 protein [Oscillospiraceae bacterium]